MKKLFIAIITLTLSLFTMLNYKVYAADGPEIEVITEHEYNLYPSYNKYVVNRPDITSESSDLAEFILAVKEIDPMFPDMISAGSELEGRIVYKFITKNGSSVSYYKYASAYSPPDVIYDFPNNWVTIGDYDYNEVTLLPNVNHNIHIDGLSNIQFKTSTSGFHDLETDYVLFESSFASHEQDHVIRFRDRTDSIVQQYLSIPNGETITFRYFSNYEEVIVTNINQLPTTNINKLADVSFNVSGLNVQIKIKYGNTFYYMNKSFALDTDMEMFNTMEAYYMNIEGDPQIFINHSDRLYLKDILTATSGEKPAFVPHTIWDLKLNELKRINDYKTNVFIKQNNQGVIIAYVYIDEFIMDKILSASLSWTSRDKLSYWWGSDKYSDWEYNEETIYSDKYLEYRDLTYNWEIYVPLWNIYRAIYKLKKIYEIPEIDYIDWSNLQPEYNVTPAEIISHFTQVNKDFEEFQDNPRYKLWAFALQEGKSFGNKLLGKWQTQIYHSPAANDPLNFKIIQVIYETDGKLYETIGSDMDLRVSVDDKLKPSEDKFAWNKIIIIALAGFYILVLYSNKGFKNLKNFISTTLIFGFVAILIYFLMGSFL